MSIRFRHNASAFLPLATIMLAATPALAGSWANTAPFGAALKGDLYTPSKPGTSPAILVVIHMCSGHSSTVHGWFDSAAEANGFYQIAPDAGKNCFDASVSSNTRNATSDPGAIVTMVNYVLAHTTADKSRVFAAGMSSGGCMTNTLLAVYPDVFAGGSAMPGFPAGLWPAGDTTCTKCNSTPGTGDTGQKYASMATSAFAFSGTRPCSEQWVGGGDQYNFNGWLPVVASQFEILGNLGSGVSAASGISGWARTVYKDTAGNVRLETNLGPSSQKHDLETVGASLYSAVVTFLGLDKPTGACGIGTAAGGASSTGGASSVAGAPSTGGTKATGGVSSVGAGGTSVAAGGAPVAGGASATGGASAAGGTKAAGGAAAAGGTKAAGGAAGDTGGASSNTSSAVTGGNSASNTTTASAQTGGNSTAATTAQATTGGSGNAGEGGNEALGGASVITSSSGSSTDQGGCGCRVAGNNHKSGTLWGFGLLSAALAAWRRRQSKVS